MTTHRYGTNGEAVEKIIERAKRLTEDEVQRLAEAWAVRAAWAAWDAARGAARDAAWAAWAAWAAARDAVRAAWAAWAAWDAAWDARGAVNDAILAEITRDLITPAQYDLLIGPWRTVIGGDK